ncbi:MAG TPA: 23S rRNA (pseudouridine(1915)-N(3))-methyltransferase RlmH [Gemmatimonadales bacterium]|nr:23S rRNA (pseudouridine(1915)-N(3))-methyltransferase RlmH [Gemmatimonadales bacterium]
MRVTLVAVGRLRPALREVYDDYATRLSRWVEFEGVEVREAARAGPPPVQRQRESRAILDALPDGAFTVLLDIDGEAWSSEALAGQLARWRDSGRPLALVIGGAEGVDAALKRAAQVRWSLGPATLPHELARVVAMEQVYRAFTILHGLPYHKSS